MGTFPDDPSLPAVTTSTQVNPAFLNTLVDNINAIGEGLGDLVNNVSDGNFDIVVDKGIKWGGNLEIYFSGGDIILDDGVQITGALSVGGALDVVGSLTVDTIDDSGAAAIAMNTTLNVDGDLDVTGTIYTDNLDHSGAALITVGIHMAFDAGLYLDVPNLRADNIRDSGAGEVTFEDNIQVGDGVGAWTITVGIAGSDELVLSGGTNCFVGFEQDTVANPANDRMRIWQDTSGNCKIVMNDGGAIHTVTLFDSPETYTVANELEDRDYDANTVAVAELADIVGTMINDLIAIGLFQ